VTIVVVDPSRSGERRRDLEIQQFMRAASFYVGATRFEDAERAARTVIQTAPNHADAHILLGDALVGLRRREDALAAYHRALALMPASYEPPNLLYARIERVMNAAR
jgi:cytochrome c-type biogenesis protein CcmH/NrfG